MPRRKANRVEREQLRDEVRCGGQALVEGYVHTDGEPPPGLLDELASIADEHASSSSRMAAGRYEPPFCYRAVTRHDYQSLQGLNTKLKSRRFRL